MNKKDKLIKWYNSIDSFYDLECWYTELPFVEDTKIEDTYWMLSRFKDTVVETLWYLPCNFINNIIKYRKFLWRDRWFDYTYILYMIQVKLEQDAKRYRRHGMCVPSTEYAEQMERAVALLKKIDKDDYEDLEELPKDVHKLFKYIDNNILGWWD